jgi:hypothetical protein
MTMPSKYSPIELSNKDFIAGVFHDLAMGAHVLGCSFRSPPDDTSSNGVWFARPLTKKMLSGRNDFTLPRANNFYCVSSFWPDAKGDIRRRKAQWAAAHCLVIDDVGDGPSAKIPWSKVKLPPSFVIETSPGNCQVGYIFSHRLEDAGLFDRLMNAIIYQGLSDTDPGMAGRTRVVRLPQGKNNKTKYKPAHVHVPYHWSPNTQYTVDDIVDAYELTLAPPTPAFKKSAGVKIDIADDPYVKALSDLGMVLDANTRDGGDGLTIMDVLCPNHLSHSDRVDEGCAYFVGTAAFRCWHGNCEQLKAKDYQQILQDVHGIDTDELNTRLKVLTMAKKHRQVEDYLKLLKARKNNG